MRGELNRLRGVEEEAKNKTNQVSSLLEELEKLRKELSATQQEKKTIEDWAQTYRDEMEKVRRDPHPFTCSCPAPPPSCAPCIYSSVMSSSICVPYHRICVFLSFLILACRSEMFP